MVSATIAFVAAAPFAAKALWLPLITCTEAATPVPAQYRSFCESHYDLALRATERTITLADQFPNCTSTRPDAKTYCIHLSAGRKLAEESFAVILNQSAREHTYRPTVVIDGETITLSERTELVPEDQAAWEAIKNAFDYTIIPNDMYVNDRVLTFGTTRGIEGLTIEPGTQLFTDEIAFHSAKHDAFMAFSEFCDAGTLTVRGDLYISYLSAADAEETKARYRACLEAIRKGDAILAALAKMEQSAPAGTGSVTERGSAISLPLPLGSISLPAVIGRVIRTLLGVVGAIALVFFIWGGIKYMTAAGDEKKVAEARGMITTTVSALAAIFLSYAVLSILLNALSSS